MTFLTEIATVKPHYAQAESMLASAVKLLTGALFHITLKRNVSLITLRHHPCLSLRLS